METESIVTVVVFGLAMAIIVLLGLVVLLRNPRIGLHQVFFGLSLSVTLWILTNLIFAVVNDASIQYAAAHLSYGAGGLLSLFFLLYCLELAGVKLQKSYRTLIYIVGVVTSLVAATPHIIAYDVNDGKVLTNTVTLVLYGGYHVAYIGAGIVAMVRARKKADRLERDKITIVFSGLVASVAIGFCTNILLPVFDEYSFVQVGPLATLIFVVSSTYAIVRHRLFDIRLAVVRTTAYVLALLTLAAVYYLMAYVVSITLFQGQATTTVSISPTNILLALVLAFLFQPIKHFFDKATNRIFYRDSYSSEVFFAKLNALLSSTIDLRGLLKRASDLIAMTLKAEQAFFFLYYASTDTATNRHMSAGVDRHTRMPIGDARMLDGYVMSSNENIFLTDMLPDELEVKRMLRSHKVALVMPLRHDGKITGYVMLGDHRSGSYTKRDLGVLLTISNSLIIAIQNALSLHEIRELNATLQQRIDVATKELRASNAQLKHLDQVKDEFMSMASHQLRTPLTSVKGYLSMVLDGDAGQVSPRQQKLLTEAFSSSERMVRLIADFLNVSRLQTGKFVVDKSDIDLKAVVEKEVENLRIMAAARKLKLTLSVPKSGVVVHGDAGKLREVIMNFIDNAIYYSKPDTTIKVEIVYRANAVEFTVHDTGIGVPKEEQGRLFGKFFRATNARKQRPDGTGVGLYLAKKIITAHRGTILFQSTEGKGSTFGFRLPLPLSHKDTDNTDNH